MSETTAIETTTRYVIWTARLDDIDTDDAGQVCPMLVDAFDHYPTVQDAQEHLHAITDYMPFLHEGGAQFGVNVVNMLSVTVDVKAPEPMRFMAWITPEPAARVYNDLFKPRYSFYDEFAYEDPDATEPVVITPI